MFKNLDFSTLIAEEDNGKIILVNKKGETVIDEFTYLQVSALMSELLGGVKKYRRKPANETAFDYIIDVEREHQANAKRMKRKEQMQFDDLIIDLNKYVRIDNNRFDYCLGL